MINTLQQNPERVDDLGLILAAMQGCTIGSGITDHPDFWLFSALSCQFSAPSFFVYFFFCLIQL